MFWQKRHFLFEKKRYRGRTLAPSNKQLKNTQNERANRRTSEWTNKQTENKQTNRETNKQTNRHQAYPSEFLVDEPNVFCRSDCFFVAFFTTRGLNLAAASGLISVSVSTELDRTRSTRSSSGCCCSRPLRAVLVLDDQRTSGSEGRIRHGRLGTHQRCRCLKKIVFFF
jgi:hypothetical protein